MLKSVQNLINAANSGAKQRQCGNHSFQRDKDGTLKFFYHWTAICVVDKNGNPTYDNGGWNTTSTKRAINSYKQYYGESVN